MSESAGPGSPISFKCHRERLGYGRLAGHTVVRTGLTRRYRPSRYSALGQRSMTTSHQYRCSCGHVGWSNHKDILRVVSIANAFGM